MTFEQERPRISLTGHDVVDSQLSKVGTVTDVLSDEQSTPKWAVVKTGVLGGERFVPLERSYLDTDGRLVVPLTKSDIKRAPRVRGDHVMTNEVQQEAPRLLRTARGLTSTLLVGKPGHLGGQLRHLVAQLGDLRPDIGTRAGRRGRSRRSSRAESVTFDRPARTGQTDR